jgi:hypothetical protein
MQGGVDNNLRVLTLDKIQPANSHPDPIISHLKPRQMIPQHTACVSIYYLLLRSVKKLTVAIFLLIKGCANFEPMIPVHKKHVVMRRVQLNRGPLPENHPIAFNFNSSLVFLDL